MSDGTASVVIIGAGIVGCSVAYHLAQRGCTDVIILGMLVIGLAGFGIDLLIRRLSKWLLPWSVGAQK